MWLSLLLVVNLIFVIVVHTWQPVVKQIWNLEYSLCKRSCTLSLLSLWFMFIVIALQELPLETDIKHYIRSVSHLIDGLYCIMMDWKERAMTRLIAEIVLGYCPDMQYF